MLEAGPLDMFYGDSHVIQGVTIHVGAGEGIAIIGRNGVGKSTLLKGLMAGGPTVRGPVRHDGEDISGLSNFQRARRGIGFVPEDRRIYPHLTVAENIAMSAHSARAGVTPYGLDEVYAFFPMLGPLAGRMGFELSGGQQQLLAIARGVFARPNCMLLDEPTEGLAPIIVEEIADQLIAMRKTEQTTLILAEQNVWFARACTERLYLIDSGRIVFEGDWAAFDSQPDLRERYLAV
ncbi:MAG: ABC transporter ATP-binding protein [Mesorhizobium sp.]|nr:ABC transporter ATP-binding protein [Mesorhizobium sp.]